MSAPEEEHEREDGLEVPVHRRRRNAEPENTSRRGLLIVIPLVMAGAAVAYLVLGGMKDNAIYSKPVDQLVQEKGRFVGRQVRAEGNLVHGSLMKREQPC